MDMDMDMDDELFTSSDDQQRHGHVIIKGKRTKRQRPFTAVTTSGSSSEGGRIFSELIYESMTEEEEDMANCLILLAQGGADSVGTAVKPRKISDQLTAAEVAVVGIYGYECKTCNRTFQSFQALGGHRASHKRPKIATPNEKKSQLQFEHHHRSYEDKKSINHINSTTLSLLHCNTTNNKLSSSSKVHECSICGAEFSSGQALGGHMRRHRTVTTTPININDQNQPPQNQIRNHVMQLDLNLPAPDEDDRETNKFQFVFASPALVDCHY